MTIEKILRSESGRTKSSEYMIHMTADEGKKFVCQNYVDSIGDNNLGYVDDNTAEPIICSQVYLGVDASELDWAEIDESEATTIMEAWEKKQAEDEEKHLTSMMDNTEL